MGEKTDETEQSNNESVDDVKTDDDTFYGKEEGGDESKDDETETKDEETEESKGDEADETAGDESKDEGEESKDKGDEGAPEKYDLKKPDDSLLDDSDMERLSLQAKAMDLSNEDAQELIDIESDAIGRYQEKLNKQVEGARKDWLKTAEADKEIGGDAFKENVELSKRVIDKFGSEGLKEALNATGFGDHAEVIRFISKIGKLMSNDSAVFADSGLSNKDKTDNEVFYGETKE